MKEYKDLLETLRNIQATGGMDVSNEAVCDYQDMIGHSCEEDLEELANGNYKEAFYRVYGVAYGTVEAIRFHCKHGKKIIELFDRIADLETLSNTQADRINSLEKINEEWIERTEKTRQAWEKAEKEKIELLKKIDELEAKNQELKAKLYDLITA